MNIKIDHIALYCLDLEAMRTFFINHFGCQSNDMYHNPRTGLKTYILSFPEGGTRLEIMSHPKVDEISSGLYKAGFIHLSIAVGSKENVVEKTHELTAAGYECVSGPRVTGDGYFESGLIGPEGIILEITV
ncbi:MAG: VOC family protein [Bacteroidaceae bacterium]